MADLRPVFVFDTDGSVLPCPSLQSNEMAYGNVTTGIDFVSESQLLNRSLPEKCLSQCELLPLCMGGCRLQALTNYGDFNGIDCQYDAYRMLLDDYVEKKAIEVLSQQGKDKFMENAD
jgi:radical SAM protein with 4Fe4S-binding SPASM domain